MRPSVAAMTLTFSSQIATALGPAPHQNVTITGSGTLPSCFATSDFAVATLAAAASELASLTNATSPTVNRRHALMWFDMTLRPTGWDMPNLWDPIAGDYETADGWIRLHTNAPHHCAAALSVLGCEADRATVAKQVKTWAKTDLETAVVAAGGAAAALHSQTDWANHPQGRAVAAEPLIHWDHYDHNAPPVALAGLKVLDLTRVLAGPVATRFLAGFGADVLRIDPPSWEEPGVVPEVTLGKRCAGLDLTRLDDRATFEHLLSQADVLVHGYRPGALSRMGFDAAYMRKIAPNLIDVSLCAYGHTGPWAKRRGFDSLVQMSSGIAHTGMLHAKSDRPRALPMQALDHGTGYLIAAAVLRALRSRNTTGQTATARLSLARSAALLTSHTAHEFHGAELPPTPEDIDPAVEHTPWGPAKRIRFPVALNGNGPTWPQPAGPLRRHPAQW